MHSKFRHYAGRLIDLLTGRLVPQRFRLPLQFHKQTLLLNWEPEARLLRCYARRSAAAIDVGANLGLWSYAMVKSGLFERVLALEPNPRLTADLESLQIPGLTVIHKAVSNTVGTSRLRIPRHNGMVLDGWASLEERIDLDTNDFQEMNVETTRLDDLRLEGVGFIKIDVEGHELNVLEGGRALFTNSRPICLIECRERNRSHVEAFFSKLNVGYRLTDTKASFGFALSEGNALFSTS
jgi:FkbM family methyltransferase